MLPCKPTSSCFGSLALQVGGLSSNLDGILCFLGDSFFVSLGTMYNVGFGEPYVGFTY